MLIVDASVAVKWFVEEEGSPTAHALVRIQHTPEFGLRLQAPGMLMLEVVAVIGRRARQGMLDADYPAKVLQALRRLGMVLTPDGEFLDHATQLSMTLRHSLYDCLYLALARRTGFRLATFDRGLADLARRDGLLWNFR